MKHQKLVRLFALTLPLIGALASAHAQDYSYNDGVNGNGGIYNNDDVYGNGNRNGNGNGNRGNGRFDTNRTRLRGTVERVYSTRSFDLRTQDGQIVRVKTDSDLNLQVGATTVVRGELRGKTFFAERVNRRDDNRAGNQNGVSNVELRGEVVEVESRRALRVRDSDDGRILRVQLQNNLNSRISRGDLVLVRGTFDGTILRADAGQVQLLSDDNRIDGNYGNGNVYGNNGNGYGYGNNGNVYGNGNNNYGTNNGVYGRSVSFPATVRVVRRGEVEVRGDNGRTYIVRFTSNARTNLRVNDRVRVNGVTRNGYIEMAQLNRAY